MDFQQREFQDGIRFSWNFWPCNKISATRVVCPVGCLYTPLKEIENMALVQYQAIACPKCNTILNPYCAIDFRFKTWMCTTCQNKNAFPPHYANNITET